MSGHDKVMDIRWHCSACQLQTLRARYSEAVMIKFLRRIFGSKRRGVFDKENGDHQYDAETQEMILSSFDLLERLIAREQDLSAEWIIGHFFVGDDSNIERASRLFESHGFLVGLKETNRLHVVERSVLDISWVEHTIPFMFQTGGEFELDYDGWDCGPAFPPSDQLSIKMRGGRSVGRS